MKNKALKSLKIFSCCSWFELQQMRSAMLLVTTSSFWLGSTYASYEDVLTTHIGAKQSSKFVIFVLFLILWNKIVIKLTGSVHSTYNGSGYYVIRIQRN